MRFSPEFVDKVREANNIVDVIGPYTQLRSTGSNFMGRCPFPDHNDKTASFSVSEDKQLYNCFGCKKSGNIFTFLQNFNGYSFPESIEFLARRANIALPERDEDPREKQARQVRESVLQVNRLAASYFQDRLAKLPENHPVRVYAKGRGLNPETLQTFGIGFAPDEWHGLARVVGQRRISMEIGEKAGLLKRSSRAQGAETHFDLFRGRLMFPIVSTSGDVVGFGGRVVGEGEPKYLNSPETQVFHKGRVLYGLDVTARYIRSQDEAIIVEGYMDAVTLYQAGIKNVAAILGTAFTPDHGRLIRRMTPNAVMLLDGDAAGIQGAERSLAALLAADIRPRGVILPEGMDPDDFIRDRGVEALKAEMAAAGDLFTLLLTRHWMEGYRATAQDKLRVVESAARALQPAGPMLLERPIAELFMDEVARFLDVDSAWVRKTLKAKMSSSAGAVPSIISKNAVSLGKIEDSAEQAATMDVETRDAAASGPTVFQKISLDGISREEIAALSLLLQSRFLIQDLSDASKEWSTSGASREDHPIAQLLHHDGARKLAGLALRKYGHHPEAFATLAASLLECLMQPEVLSKGLADVLDQSRGGTADAGLGVSAEGDRKQMAKILTALSKSRKLADLQQISLRLRESRGPEQSRELMEKFMIVKRELQAIEREQRSNDIE